MTAATLSGLKLNDHLQYRNKVNYFSKLTQDFRLKAPSEFKAGKHYLPDWTDEALWSYFYNNKASSQDVGEAGKKFKERFPTSKNFKDYCFEEAKKDENFKVCSQYDGWCSECIRDPDWDKEYLASKAK